jgi:dipeptidyl aminopeptidase/acylaminoacyl peptidase
MNARRDDLDRLVSEWLHSDASTSGSERVLAPTLSRVAVTGQERHVTQRVFGDRLGASPQLRWALLAAALATAVLASVLLTGALRREPPPPPGPATNGWVAFSANGEAGDRLQETNVDRGIGKGDIYVVQEGAPARRIIGSGEDGLHQTCPVFSPDGTMLAYREVGTSAGTATPPPQPGEGAPEEAPPTADQSPGSGTSAAAIVVVRVGRDGTVGSIVARIPIDAASCLEWSPDSRSLAFLVATPSDGQELRVATLDGQVSRLGPAADLTGHFAWSPDGSTIALQNGGQLWLVPLDASAPRSVASGEFGTISWSPDGARLAVGIGATVRVMGIDGTLVADLAVEVPGMPGTDERAFAWSPDGRWIAWVEAEDIVRSTPDAEQLKRRPFDVARVLDLTEPLYPPVPWVLGWSADGERLLVAAGSVDTPGAILAVPWAESASPVVLIEPTYALRGIRASWQVVHD